MLPGDSNFQLRLRVYQKPFEFDWAPPGPAGDLTAPTQISYIAGLGITRREMSRGGEGR